MEIPLRHGRFPLEEFPVIMGILNVTPDSFSDGGEHFDPKAATAHALALIADGARIIDFGPESTRPGARAVTADEQLQRCIPVIEAVRKVDRTTPLSIDTRSAEVARAALDAGADIINDVSALRDDPEMAALVAEQRVPVVLIHRRGSSETMQAGGGPHYDDIIGEITGFLRERVDFAVNRGVDRDRIILDPGIGFGKRVEHNLSIMRRLDRFVELGLPILIGASRKSFIGAVLQDSQPRSQGGAPRKETGAALQTSYGPKDREAGSLACAIIAALAGVSIIRVHEVRPAVEALRMCRAVRDAT